MKQRNLPERYKGYATEELLSLYKQVRGKGIIKGTPKAKILAMSQLIREYRLSPESRF